MPERARDILLTTDLGAWLRQQYPQLLAPQQVFRAQPDGRAPEMLEYPQSRWEQDYQRALARYLVSPADAPVSAGIVAIQAADSRAGSPFLRFRQMPAEWVRQHHLTALGTPPHYTCVLNRFQHHKRQQRLAIWRIGQRKLRDLQLSLDTWQQVRTELCDPKPQRWRRASARATTVLLEHGATQRLLQACVQSDVVKPGWLDALLIQDVSSAIAAVVGEPPDGEVPTWTEMQQYFWLTCALPRAGDALITQALTRLPQSDDDAVLQAIGIVFLGLYAPRGRALPHLDSLLAPEALARIRQSPQCYGELLWRLGEVLDTGVEVPRTIVQRVRAVLTEVSEADNDSHASLAAKATTFVRLATRGHCVDEMVMWLEHVMESETLTLEAVRVVLQIAAESCTALSERAKNRICQLMTRLSASPRFARLWEVYRLWRECCRARR